MKRFTKQESLNKFQALKEPNKVQRSNVNLGSNGTSCCIECPDVPCTKIPRSGEVSPKLFSICPTDAIRTNPAGEIVISNECISCGLCAILCPVAAIEVTMDTAASVQALRSAMIETTTNQDEFIERRKEVLQKAQITEEDVIELSNQFSMRSSSLTQKSFYRLVAALFECLGIETFLPPAGDTSNRIDLVLVDSVQSLAVEIKSATETRSINIKSVQQALENKIILDQRQFFNSTTTSSSLVVGYSYPPERSGVQELIVQINKTFEIRIGLISIVELYRRVLRQYLMGIKFDRSELLHLFGEMK